MIEKQKCQTLYSKDIHNNILNLKSEEKLEYLASFF